MAEAEKRPRAPRRPLRPVVAEQQQSLRLRGKGGQGTHERLLRRADGVDGEDRQGEETARGAQAVGREGNLSFEGIRRGC